MIREGLRTEDVIERHWAAIDKFDPDHRTKLIVDEWGVWYPPGEETAPSHLLSQPLTLRDALHTAVTFDVFNRHADKIAMANVAQTINCIHSLFLAQGDRYARTPVYSRLRNVQEPHGRAVRAVARALRRTHGPRERRHGKMPGLSGSASLKDGTGDGDAHESLARFAADRAHPPGRRNRHRGPRHRAHPRRQTARNTFDRPDEVTPRRWPSRSAAAPWKWCSPSTP